MDGEKPLADQPGEGGTSRPVVSTNFTSEAFRIEIRDGERPNSFQAQESLLTSQPGTQSIQKKKTPSFQITSVVPNDGGEESPDETEDMSDILDSSKIEPDSEKETPSFSEEYSKSEDVVGTANELPSSTQYGITAVVQQNQSGGLLTSRLPPGITVNVTKGGIALAETDGVVPNDADNLSNRFKIVKIASNKPFKKGRWVCFDFMDSPATSAVGVRGSETPFQQSVAIPLASQPPLNQGQPMTNQQVPQQMMHIQTNQHVQQQLPPQSAMGQQQYGSNQTGTMNPVPSVYSQMSAQGFQSIASSTMTSVTQKNLPLNVQQLHQHLQHQQIHQMHQQQQMQQQTQNSVGPSQVLDSQPMGSISQASVSSNVNESSPIGQAVIAVSGMQQQLNTNQDSNQPQNVLQQPLPQGIGSSIPSNQSMMSQPPQQYQPMPSQHIQQPPQSHPSQHVISSQQQTVTQMQVPSQQQQQQQQQLPMNQEQINAVQDQSPNSHSTPNYHPSQQQSQMVSQPVNFSAQAQLQQSTTQASQLNTAQHTVPPTQGAAQVPQGSLVHTCGMSSFVTAPSQTTTATSMGSSASFSSQMKASAAAAAAQMVSGQIIPSIVPEATEGTSEQGGASDENTPGDEDKTSLRGLAATLTEKLRSPEFKPITSNILPSLQPVVDLSSFSHVGPSDCQTAESSFKEVANASDPFITSKHVPGLESARKPPRSEVSVNEPVPRAQSVPPRPEHAYAQEPFVEQCFPPSDTLSKLSRQPSVESLVQLSTSTEPTFCPQELVMSLEAAKKKSLEGAVIIPLVPQSDIVTDVDIPENTNLEDPQHWMNVAPTAMQKRYLREAADTSKGQSVPHDSQPSSHSSESAYSGRSVGQMNPVSSLTSIAPASSSAFSASAGLGGHMFYVRSHPPPAASNNRVFHRLDHSSSAGHLPCVYDTEVENLCSIAENVRMPARPARPSRFPNRPQDSYSGVPRETASLPPPSPVDSKLRDADSPHCSASTASTVAIDNKIEQAMDLVKSHLMFAVREEVDVLKERIGELMERINHLEYENTVLRKYASPEALQQLQHPSANP